MARFFLTHHHSALPAQGPAIGQGQKSPCLLIDLTEKQQADLIRQGVISPIQPQYSGEDRRHFIQAYTRMIARLNQEHGPSLLWWATDLSSKNRYTSLAAVYIQELMDIVRAVAQYPDTPLLVTGVSPAVVPSLEKYFQSQGLAFSPPRRTVKGRAAVWIKRFKKMAAVVWFGCGMYQRARAARVLKAGVGPKLVPQEEFYVIKSFAYDTSFDGKGVYNDAFFGCLPSELKADAHVLVLVNVLGDFHRFLRQAAGRQDFMLVPLEYFLKGADVVKAIFEVLSFRVRLSGPVVFEGMDVTDIVRYELFRAFQGVDIQQFLHYHCLCRLCRQVSIGTFAMTYENNPWERMCTLALRAFSPATKIIGYQHAVVPEAALNMFLDPVDIKTVPLPDKIITVGPVTAEILYGLGQYPQGMVETGPALRYEYLVGMKAQSRGKPQGRLLLVLDGVEQTRQMLTYVLSQLRDQPHYQLRIRCHPALPWKVLSGKYHFDIHALVHVEISTAGLQEDLLWSDAVIYWQSTIVLEAICMGKPTINFKSQDILSFDPLFQTGSFKWTAAENDDLIKVIKAVEGIDDKDFHHQCESALLYVRRYFQPVTPQELRLFKFDV
jgi:hypothetical protein